MNSCGFGSRPIISVFALFFTTAVGFCSLRVQCVHAVENSAEQEAKSVDKRNYNLFNPTPPELMREFQTDRPDKTESPYTLDAGHFAIETSIISYTWNNVTRPDPSRPQQQILIGDNNFKVGLLNNMDLQLLFQTFIWQRVKTGLHSHSEETGVGDAQIRLKTNLWGNEGGSSAMAIMPWLGLPTNQVDPAGDKVTGGMIFPFQVEGPFDWKICMMTETDSINDSSGGGYHLEWINSIALHHDIIKDVLDGYVEFFSNNNFETGSPWVATVDVGLIYQVSKDLYLDCGVNIGVTRDADGLNPFIGISKRF
jgi:hypothetical protein